MHAKKSFKITNVYYVKLHSQDTPPNGELVRLADNDAAMRRSRIDLTPAGPDWADWTFGPYGNCRSFRLITPTGEALSAPEVAALRREALDYSYLVGRTRALELEVTRLKNWCSPDDAQVIRSAFALIQSILPDPMHHEPYNRFNAGHLRAGNPRPAITHKEESPASPIGQRNRRLTAPVAQHGGR
jgi:hypothetical protein